jgi:molybdenum cofactor synthesis domain-containing protein
MMPALMDSRSKQPTRAADRKRPSGEPIPRPVPERGGAVRVEIISIGRELLRGKIPDSNAQHIARLLTQRNTLVRRVTIVDDSVRAVADALTESLQRDPHRVVTSGGLGPADDDRTLEGVAEVLQIPLKIDSATKAMVEAAYENMRSRKVVRHSGMTAQREKLCRIPLGGTPVPNPHGISPGVFVRLAGGTVVLSLPGMPQEMGAVLEAALPMLPIEFEGETAVREVESPGSDEAELAPLIDRLASEFPAIWINTRLAGSRRTGGRVLIRLEATAATKSEAESVVEQCVRRLLELVSGSP